jgi:hypothetical protein
MRCLYITLVVYFLFSIYTNRFLYLRQGAFPVLLNSEIKFLAYSILECGSRENLPKRGLKIQNVLTCLLASQSPTLNLSLLHSYYKTIYVVTD